MITHFGKSLTPNQAAKLIIAELGINNWWLWEDREVLRIEAPLTAREIALIESACFKQSDRVREFLGISQIVRKVHDW